MPARTLDAILTEINLDIQNNISYPSNNFFTEAWLQPRNEINWPLIRIGKREGKKITPVDTRALQVYHRQIEPIETQPLEVYRGVRQYVNILYNMRLVGVGARANITSKVYNDTADLANEVMEILAVNSSLTNRERLMVEGTANTNTLEVLNEEYEGNESTNQKWSLDYIAFSIDYTITQKRLGNSC